MSRENLDRICERGILALVLGILAFGPLAFGAVDALSFVIIQGATALVVLLWGVRLWANRRFPFLWPPVCWAVLAFAVYAIVRYFTADIEYVARQELLRVLVYVFLFLAIVNNLNRKESAQIVSVSLVFLAMAISIYAFYQFITNSQKVWHLYSGYAHRGSGTYISPNHLAGFLEMILPVGVAYALAGRGKHVTRILLGYASLVILAGIAVTLSRGGWISAAVSLLVLFGILITQRAYRLQSALLLLLIVGACIVLFPKSYHLIRRAQTVKSSGNADPTGDGRFLIWPAAEKLWSENPWWGVGPAHFDYRFRTVRPEELQLQPDRVHNDYLNLGVDWGIAGCVIMAVVLGLLALGLVQVWSRVRPARGDLGPNKNSNTFAFFVGASCGLVAIAVHSFVDFNLHIPANAILATTLVALLSCLPRFATDRWWHHSKLWTRLAASIVLAGGVFFLGQQTWRHGVEWAWLDRAHKAPLNSPEQVGLLTRAFQAEPKNFETAMRIGEAYRRLSQEGAQEYPELPGENYVTLANKAFEWYERAAKLNRWDGYASLGRGWCLDQIDKKSESEPYFQRAEELDPRGYFTLANIGVHYFEIGDLLAARTLFERSWRLQPFNDISVNYLALIQTRLTEAATNDVSARLYFPSH